MPPLTELFNEEKPRLSCFAVASDLVGRAGLEPLISSVSGNDIGRSCFRILTLSCDVWSADVRGCTPPSKAVVTRLVTHIGLTAPEAVGRLPRCLRRR